jgi:hypothetical protein
MEPVDFLIASEENKPPSERRFGFSVLAIDCLVVETLGAFIEGLEHTEGKSKKTFCTFLRTRKQFAAEFTTDDLVLEEPPESTSVCAFASSSAATPMSTDSRTIIRRMVTARVSWANLRCNLHTKGQLLFFIR